MTSKENTNTDQEMEMKNGDDQPEKVAEQETHKEHSKGKKAKGKKGSPETLEAEYRQQVDELNDKYLRLYSEFDNFRRRTSREKLELAKTASEELIIELLPVLDDFERAVRSAEETQDCDAVKEGMTLIHSKLRNILTKKGLAPIEAKGAEFDTDFHEAITYIPAASDDLKGKVVDEIEKGYRLNDKVIRYAKVVLGQ